MKKDQLEKFIEDNRAEFDRKYPDTAIWDRISDELDKKEYRHQPRIYTIMRMAAAVVLLLAVGFVVGMYSFSPDQEKQMMVNMGPENYKRYQDINNYYTHQVSSKMNEVQNLKAEKSIGDSSTLSEDLQQLDAIFSELKNELMENHEADEERIINAMILNYQTKLEILERVADKLKKQSKTQQKDNETVDI